MCGKRANAPPKSIGRCIIGKDYPEPPSARQTASASTSTNVGTAIANAYLGNVNQQTPDGSLTYDQTGTHTWYDPFTKKSYDIPTFTATQALSPQQQAIYDQTKGTQLNLATLANNQSGFLNDYMAEPFKYNPGEHEKWALDLYEKLNNESRNKDREALMARLANQGIGVGSGAYDDAMSTLYKGQGDARNKFLLDSYQTGFGTAQAERNQPINEITALLSGSQVSQPNFVPTNMPTIPTTDVAGLINENYRQRLGIAQQQNAFTSDILGGLFGMGGAFLGRPRVAS